MVLFRGLQLVVRNAHKLYFQTFLDDRSLGIPMGSVDIVRIQGHLGNLLYRLVGVRCLNVYPV